MPLPDLRIKYTRHSPTLDTYRRHLTDLPTPQGFASILQATDTGDLGAAVELNEEMEAKDAHLQGVANTRRLALTALPWDVMPDADAEDQDAAESAADFVRESLRKVHNWEKGLDHLATAIGPGIAVLELVWNRGRLVEVEPVAGHRLIGDMFEGRGVFVQTDDYMLDGVEATNPKFVVFTPSSRAGFPLRVTITRAQSYLWIIKHYAIADWSSFSETYGQPVRIAKFDPASTPEEQTQVKSMLENMGSDLWACFSDKVDIQFLEAARNSQPFEGMVDWVERKQTILYLGQTTTTEPGVVGSLALGRVHADVRAALTLSDIKAERNTVRDQVFRWMVKFRWPGRDIPIPGFVRQTAEGRDLDADRLEMEKLKFMAERGLQVDNEVIYERLNIPQPKRTTSV